MSNNYCGYVAIIGRPNVGKSTLLNKILGEKLSITANKPQTTRFNILGIKTVDNRQAIFIDTPGMHVDAKKAINQQMNKQAKLALADADVIIFVVDWRQWNNDDDLVLQYLQYADKPTILALNKVDTTKDRDQLLPVIQDLSSKFAFQEVLPISAYTGSKVSELEELIMQGLPESEFYYAADSVTDQSMSVRITEIIREKLTHCLSQELPYALDVELEDMSELANGQLGIHALIWVERDSQKAIVIGRHGQQLKRVGQLARMQLNSLLKKSVHLKLWVKVRTNAG